MSVQVLYSLATQRFSRSTLFNIVILTFMGWFVAFGLLYPSHESIHFHGFAEDTLKTLPSGLAGAVGMVSCMTAIKVVQAIIPKPGGLRGQNLLCCAQEGSVTRLAYCTQGVW